MPTTLAYGQRPNLLTLSVKPFITGNHPVQRIHVSVDGIPVFSGDLTRVTTLEIPLVTRPSVETYHVVEFTLPDAVSPLNAGLASSDSRQLAIGLLTARLDVELPKVVH